MGNQNVKGSGRVYFLHECMALAMHIHTLSKAETHVDTIRQRTFN